MRSDKLLMGWTKSLSIKDYHLLILMIRLRKYSLKLRFELIELLNVVIGEIDVDHKKSNYANETPSDHADRINGVLTVLGFGIDVKREI